MQLSRRMSFMKQLNSEYLKKLDEASVFLKSKLTKTPDCAVILGSGLGNFADQLTNKVTISYSDIPHFPKTTVAGHQGELILGNINDKYVLALKGRYHLYEGHDLNQVVFPVRLLKILKIANLVITNAAGGINENFHPGDLVLIEDHINLTGKNPLIGDNMDELGTRFPDMSTAYDKDFGRILKNTATKNNINLKTGTYYWYTGPSYETPAEIRALRVLGADMVGMSTIPEVIAGHHCGLKIVGISCITNYASGIKNEKLNHSDVSKAAQKMKEPFSKLLVDSISQL